MRLKEEAAVRIREGIDEALGCYRFLPSHCARPANNKTRSGSCGKFGVVPVWSVLFPMVSRHGWQPPFDCDILLIRSGVPSITSEWTCCRILTYPRPTWHKLGLRWLLKNVRNIMDTALVSIASRVVRASSLKCAASHPARGTRAERGHRSSLS